MPNSDQHLNILVQYDITEFTVSTSRKTKPKIFSALIVFSSSNRWLGTDAIIFYTFPKLGILI